MATGPDPRATVDDHRQSEVAHTADTRWRWPRHRGWEAGVAVFVAAFIPRLIAAGQFHSVDEQRWMARSERFVDALIDLRWSEASSSLEGVATMPGITTVWLGGIAKIVWRALDTVGVLDASAPFPVSPSAWVVAQILAAFANAALIVVLWWVVRRWAGAMVATIAAILLATEPFMVAHGVVLHTDSFVTLFGTISLVAMLVALGLPSPGRGGLTLCDDASGRRRFAFIAGLSFAGAVLTKLNAALYGPFLIAIIAIAVRSAEPRDPTGHERREILRLTGLAVVAGSMTIVLAWPALWLDPLGQFEVLRTSAEMAGGGHLQFFRGEITWTPGLWYYPFVIVFRASPWLLIAGTLGAVMSIVDRTQRPFALALFGMVATHMVVLSMAAKQIDRYAMFIWPALAVFAGLAVRYVVQRVSPAATRASRWLGAVTALALVVHAAVIAPTAIAWFSPLPGGSERAEQTLLIGWGEGLYQAGQRVEEIEGPLCHQRRIGMLYQIPASVPCGELVTWPRYDELRPGDYLFLYVGQRQRSTEEELDALLGMGPVIDEVWIGGIRYVEIIRISEP